MSSPDLTALAGFALDAKTAAALDSYAELAAKWTQRINLVSRSTQGAIRERHIADSAQLFPLIPPSARRFADLGSGGGFPGLVLAILAAQHTPGTRHVLVESDQRKAAFLREAVRLTGAPAEVICARIEAVAPLNADVVTARALAALPLLLDLAVPHLAPGGVAILPKGAGYQAEIDTARQNWAFDLESFPSHTEPEARLLRLSHITRPSGYGA